MNDDRRPDIDELILLVELPGPLPDGVEDALWESTAELYERQLRAGGRESRTEIVPLSLERSGSARRRRTWMLAGAAALVALLIGLTVAPRSDDVEEPMTTLAPSTTTTTTSTTSSTTTSTTVPPIVLGSGYFGVVWEDATDPTRVNATEGRPELVVSPMSMRVDSIVMTPGPDESPFCARAVEEGATDIGGNEQVLPEIVSCLVVGFQFDVGDEAANNGLFGAQPGMTADGDEIVLLETDEGIAPPGGSATGSAVFGNLGPGSTVSLLYSVDLEGGGVLFDRWEFDVPDALQPIDWFDDGS